MADVTAITAGIDSEPPAAIVNGDYPNRRFASVVPRSVFLAGRPVAAALLRLPERRLTNAPLLAGSPHLAPAAPRAAAVASASRAANRLADAAGPRLTRAVHALARILKPRTRITTARPALLVRPAAARGTSAASTRTVSQGHPARPRVIAATTSHAAARPRLHFAAVHRAMAR